MNPEHEESTTALHRRCAPKIMVPVDGTACATSALPVARGLADLHGASLHLIHVTEHPLPAHELLQKLNLPPEQMKGLVLDQLTGPPASSIIRVVHEQAGIAIVMCPHTAPEKPRGTLGSVARAVLQAAGCPVVLVPPERGAQPWALHRLLLPHDGTPASTAAVEPAGLLALRSHARFTVLHVAAPGTPRPEPGAFGVPRYMDHPEHEWPSWAHEFLDRARILGHAPEGVKMQLVLATGEPGHAIIKFARQEQSDLIALPWRGKLEPEQEPTATLVIREAPCPLIVYRVSRSRS